jgi:uncharacterized protein
MTRFLVAAATLFGISALAFALTLRPGTLPAEAQTATDVAQTIAVVGEGEASGTPEVATLSLSVQNEARTAREAIDANSAAMAQVIEAMKRLGIPDRSLRTTGVSVNPVRARPQPNDTQPAPIVGYQANNSLSVTVDPVGKVGEVIDAGIGAGANVTGGLRFAMKDDAALQKEALDMAVKNARVKADAMAAAAGLRIVGVRTMTDESGGGVPVLRAEAQGLAAADARAVPVQPGELTLRTRVRVVYTFA